MSIDIDLLDLPIDLSAKTSLNREQRAHGTNIFYGQASELVAQAKAGELKNCQRKFQQTAGCILNFYLTTRVITIRDAAVVFHGPVGCSSGALTYRETFRGIPTSLGRATLASRNALRCRRSCAGPPEPGTGPRCAGARSLRRGA